jgi:integrase
MPLGFVRHARKLGFKGLRFHDLRGSHETALLDAGVPVHTVAASRGHDPATLLRTYAKRTRKADTSAAAVLPIAWATLQRTDKAAIFAACILCTCRRNNLSL